MKTVLLILLIPFLFAAQSAAANSRKTTPKYRKLATFAGDTSAYLKYNFFDRKEKYINRPLRLLLKDIEIPILSYMVTRHHYKSGTIKTCGLALSVHPAADLLSGKKGVTLILDFSPSLSEETVTKLGKKNSWAWTRAELNSYGSELIRLVAIANEG